MTIIVCDKCGERIKNYPLSNARLPSYIIKKYYSPIETYEVNLCPACEKAFEEWLETKENKEA